MAALGGDRGAAARPRCWRPPARPTGRWRGSAALELPPAAAARAHAARRRGRRWSARRRRDLPSPSTRWRIAASSTIPASASRSSRAACAASSAAAGATSRSRSRRGRAARRARDRLHALSSIPSLRVAARAAPPPRLFVPLGTDAGDARRSCAREDWTTVAALDPGDDAARRGTCASSCSHVLRRRQGRAGRSGSEEKRWRTSRWSAPSGATRARARSSTGCPSGPTWWCASRAGTMPATRW